MCDNITEIRDQVDLMFRSTTDFWKKRIKEFGVDGSLAPVTPEAQKERAALLQMTLIMPVLGWIQHPRVLEIGCGSGRMGWIPQFAAQYTGIDFMPEMIEKAKERHPQYSYQVADIRELPFPDNSFDIVIGVDIASSVKWMYEKEVLPQILRVLSAEGLYILAENNFVRFQWKHE